jgi:prefoldin subunit 5
MREAFNEKTIFDQLLASLPSEYDVVRDTLDAQGVFEDDINNAVKTLERKEDKLKKDIKNKNTHLASGSQKGQKRSYS